MLVTAEIKINEEKLKERVTAALIIDDPADTFFLFAQDEVLDVEAKNELVHEGAERE